MEDYLNVKRTIKDEKYFKSVGIFPALFYQYLKLHSSNTADANKTNEFIDISI